MPPPSGRQLAKIEETISATEHASENLELTADEALGHALALERSELNEFDDAWLRGFKPDLGNLTQAWVPAHEQHVQRLADAICKFTVKENLHKEAAALLTTCNKKSLGEQTFDGS